MLTSHLQQSAACSEQAAREAAEDAIWNAFDAGWRALWHYAAHRCLLAGVVPDKASSPEFSVVQEASTHLVQLRDHLGPDAQTLGHSYRSLSISVMRSGGCWNETIRDFSEIVVDMLDETRTLLGRLQAQHAESPGTRRYGSVEVLAGAGVFAVAEIMPLLAAELSIELDGVVVDQHEQRLQCFVRNGCGCRVCGLDASYFRIEKVRSANHHGKTLSLYGIDQGRPVYFTKDHIIPRSLGGPDTLDNYQTLCWPCNSRRGAPSALES